MRVSLGGAEICKSGSKPRSHVSASPLVNLLYGLTFLPVTLPAAFFCALVEDSPFDFHIGTAQAEIRVLQTSLGRSSDGKVTVPIFAADMSNDGFIA